MDFILDEVQHALKGNWRQVTFIVTPLLSRLALIPGHDAVHAAAKSLSAEVAAPYSVIVVNMEVRKHDNFNPI